MLTPPRSFAKAGAAPTPAMPAPAISRTPSVATRRRALRGGFPGAVVVAVEERMMDSFSCAAAGHCRPLLFASVVTGEDKDPVVVVLLLRRWAASLRQSNTAWLTAQSSRWASGRVCGSGPVC